MTIYSGERPTLDASHSALAALTADGGAGASGPRYVVDVLGPTPSTNSVAADRARAGTDEGLIVATDHQTVGRGRLDRGWATPAGSALTFSVLLRPEIPALAWPWLPLTAGVAVHAGLVRVGARPGLKWPNDVLIGERKIAGILVERVDTDQGPAAVLGIGVNVAMSADELPVPTATSLAVEGISVEREVLLAAILTELAAAYRLLAGGAGALRSSYVDKCVTLGRRVRAELPSGGALIGTAVGVDEGGRLVVRAARGETAVGAGDIVHLRNAE